MWTMLSPTKITRLMPTQNIIDMNKAVVIGDCHFTNAYPSFDYLEKQLQTIEHILLDVEDADYIIFLGDVFHFRKPDPETIVKVKVFFVPTKH